MTIVRAAVLMVLMESAFAWGQVQPVPSAPAPCVETMPGMTMCPKADVPAAQAPAMGGMQGDTGMMELMQNMHPQTFLQEIEHHAASGTSAEPNVTPVPMLMSMKSNWMLMLHGNAFVMDMQQTGARGGDKFFSTNWVMGMAEKEVGPGQFTARMMLSLEPATVTGEQYPLLFQQGETAYGLPIVDGQHPHDFVMELAALYDWKLGERTLLSFYGAPVGDPAIGPTAFPHRASAAENPVAALGHHQEDSTHISYDVVTVGFTHGIVRLEGSGFHGREPGEFRWDIDGGAIDSWATRVTVQPGKNWSGQYSYARITSPEALFPTENQARTTASVMYGRALTHGNWASTALWGRTRSLEDNSKENSYLLESTLRFATRNYVWTRMENAGRTNELLNGEKPLPPGFVEEPIGHVAAYTFGYDRDFDLIPHVRTAFGGQISFYGVPQILQADYGSHPVGGVVFVRFRPFSGDER
jgi:hypothetical protein